MNDQSKLPDSNRNAFHTTSWSLVIQARANDSSVVKDALTQLCEAYWYPLYVFVRCKGYSVTAAEDLTQSFFKELLEKDTLGRADQERGKFRTFLLVCLSNFLNNHRRDEHTEKRGGGKLPLSLDFEKAENQFQNDPHHNETPERIFDRNWALALLKQVMSNLKQQYNETGKIDLFEKLQPCLVGQNTESYSDLGKSLNMKEGAVKLAVHRLRERYGQQLRLQIAKTTENPDEVDEELKHLFQSLGD